MEGTNTQNFLTRFLDGFIDTLGEDSEHFRDAHEAVVDAKGQPRESILKTRRMFAENPTLATIQDMTGIGPMAEELKEERAKRGMGLSADGWKRTGQAMVALDKILLETPLGEPGGYTMHLRQ